MLQSNHRTNIRGKRPKQRCHVTNRLMRNLPSMVFFAAVFLVAIRFADIALVQLPSSRLEIATSRRDQLLLSSLKERPSHQPLPPDRTRQAEVPRQIQTRTCAIILYGLPRAFISLVLPSLKRHVIQINTPRYHCDYFVHWYRDRKEPHSRSGRGGILDDFDSMSSSLENAIKDSHYRHDNQSSRSLRGAPPEPKIHFRSDNNETFWETYGNLMNRILTETGRRAFRKQHEVNPRLLYWPVKDKSYSAQSMVNLVKMWHSIQAGFQLMENVGERTYDRVAMLRSDVVYLTPLDIWKYPSDNNVLLEFSNSSVHHSYNYDVQNQYAVAPGGFSMYPVNDRLIVGPSSAIKVWATERFSRLGEHVHKTILEKEPGFGMHSERFLFHSIFPRMGVPVLYDREMCLVRVRADRSVWISDCGNVDSNCQTIEQDLLQGRTCRRPLQRLDPKIHRGVIQLLCDNL
ncbi:hypothetical protein ACA910_000220 [Epithemia clementina (nom. ined.)]